MSHKERNKTQLELQAELIESVWNIFYAKPIVFAQWVPPHKDEPVPSFRGDILVIYSNGEKELIAVNELLERIRRMKVTFAAFEELVK